MLPLLISLEKIISKKILPSLEGEYVNLSILDFPSSLFPSKI